MDIRMNKKRIFTLFFLILSLSGSFLSCQDLPDSLWHLSNTHPEGVQELYLYLRADGVAELHYFDSDFYRLREEEWYRMNEKRLIIQDYMGEFIVLNIMETGEELEINSPVNYFSGIFYRMNQGEKEIFLNRIHSTAENR